MITINGLTITDGLVAVLKMEYAWPATKETTIDEYMVSLMEINDYLLDRLTEACPDDIKELKELSLLLVNAKAIRDMLNRLNVELKQCIETD